LAMLAALREEAEAADASLRRTVEEERAVMAQTRQQAVEHGVNAKGGGEHGWVGSMRRKFERYLEKHGASSGYDAAVGIEADAKGLGLVRDFMDWCYSGLGREKLFSGVGRKGFADEYFSLHMPYALSQKVFPMMGMPGWTGLEKNELQARAAPFKDAIKDYWSRLKESRDEVEDLGRSLRKEKWDDLTYFLVQDACMGRLEQEPSVALMELALMGFVRSTCARAGSMGKDWFDRAGLTLLFVGRNVLSVKDFTWAKEHFVIDVPNVAIPDELQTDAEAELSEAQLARLAEALEEALRAEVDFHRIKKHYIYECAWL